MSFACLLLSSPLRSSTVSVVFDFNDSLNNDTPLSPMSPAVSLYQIRYTIAHNHHECGGITHH